MGPYCENDDLRVGDLTVSDPIRTQFVSQAAEEINAALAAVFELPLTPVAPATELPAYARLQLKLCNALIASGRLFLDRAAVAEDASLHAYGESMLREGQMLLLQMAGGAVVIDAVKIASQASEGNAPRIINADASSPVEFFYEWGKPGWGGISPAPSSWGPGS